VLPLPSLVALPSLLVDEGARRLALAHLETANAARSRLISSADPEALHDYRVALRRVRSCLRAYRRTLRSTVSRKSVRRLRRLAHGTNRGRDLQVHLVWLGEQVDRVGELERPGVSWLVERLTDVKRATWDQMLRRDQELFPKVHDRLRAELTEFRLTIRLDRSPHQRSLAAATGGLVPELSQQLKNRLSRIHSYCDEKAVHRARIAAKHLRYLVEPFAPAVRDGDALVRQLKGLQDGFGEVHDAHVFVAELRRMIPQASGASSRTANYRPGIESVMFSLRARGGQAFVETSRHWLHDADGPFFQKVHMMAGGVARLADQTQEVDRDFLLSGLLSNNGADKAVGVSARL
jgi:CHAD domain-containing protein